MWLTPTDDEGELSDYFRFAPAFTEQEDVLLRFTEELRKPTGDGGRKRVRGDKPPWYLDKTHESAVFSHLMKWKRGEVVDPDSGAHPLVHAAWRLLAIACQETGNVPYYPKGDE
jgi:hypothetical protein